MSTIINTGTITETFDVTLQDQTIEAGSTSGPAATVIFSGDSLVTAASPSLNDTSLLTNQVSGHTGAENTLLQTLGTFVNAGTVAADAAVGSIFTIDIQPLGTGGVGGQFIDDGLITLAAGNTLAVTVGSDAAFAVEAGGTLAVAAGAALDIGTPGSGAALGAVNVAAGQVLAANGTIEAAVVNDGTIAASNSGATTGSTGGELLITGSVGGTGTLVIGGGATLDLAGSVGGQTIVFSTGAPETLVLGTPGTAFSQPIVDFQDGDTITFSNGVSIEAAVLAGTTLTLTTSTGQYVFNDFTLAPDAGSSFSISANHQSISLPAQVFTWQPPSAGTDYGTAANWAATTAPGANDDVNFDSTSASGTITGSGTAGQLEFGGSTAWVLDGASLEDTEGVLVGEPDGVLQVTNGATLDGLSAATDQIGSAAGSSASATVSGTGSAWETLGTLAVGVAGSGALTVSNGGTVSAASGIIAGQAYGGAGSITVEGGADISTSGMLLVGDGAGASGTIQVLAGGTLATTGGADASAVELGIAAGASGSITVNGTAALFDTAGAPLSVGVGGSGSLLVSDGGTVSTLGGASSGGLALGTSSGGSGQVSVSGSGSALDNAGSLVIGESGLGALFVTAGGQLSTNPAVGASGPAAAIAADPGSDGSAATVSGAGSDWSLGGSLVVGDQASGSLAITQGGSVGATALVLGNAATGAGALSLSGSASALTLGGALVVGAAGAGNLSISAGATLTAAAAVIGQDPGSSGVIDIEGSGSRLDIAGDLDIGEAGAGVLILGAGNTTLSVEGNLNIGPDGELIQFGGVIDPANETNDNTVRGAGTTTITGTLTNDGEYFVQDGSFELDVGTLITGSGTLAVDDGGDFIINAGSVADTQQVVFNNDTAAAVLTIGTLATFGAVLENFNTLASIVLSGTTVGSDAYTAGTDGADGVLTLYAGAAQSGGVLGTLSVSAAITAGGVADLEMVSDGTIGADPSCFAAGTRIATPAGEAAVETLRVGDRVRVLGAAGAAPVVWLGHRHVDCRHHPRPRAVWPVRVAAGAFGPGRPGRDLWLSPDHALWLEGVLIPVKYLIDGVMIAQVPCERVSYYHVELPRHGVLLAEGLAAESYLDTGERGNFANGGGVLALYPDFAALRREAAGCAPLVVVGREVEAARQLLAAARRRAA